jgi:hypothetical protein
MAMLDIFFIDSEVAILFGTAARYFRGASGSSHDDAHPNITALYTGEACLNPDFVESRFFM